jgi:hypothetical protein
LIIKSINSGLVPNFHSAWEEVVKKQYEQFLEEAKKNYAEFRGVSVEKMPYEESELILRLQAAKEEAIKGLKGFNERRVEYEEMVAEEFEGFFRDDLQFTLDANSAASEAFNVALIERIFRGVLEKVAKNKYSYDFSAFESEWLGCMKEYEKQAKGPGKIIAVTQFYRKNQHSAFSKFFNSTTENYEEEIKRLRKLQKDFQNEFFEPCSNPMQEMIDNHVFKT